jgi:hypothetical protein
VLALVWIAVTAALRIHGGSAHTIGPLAVVPSAALVLALALLIEAGAATPGPAASDNGSGAAVALALFRAAHDSAPGRLAVELVLCGAHEGGAIGLRRHLRTRRRELRRSNAVVLGLAACGAGAPRWWDSDGPLWPHRTSAPVRALAQELGQRYPDLGLRAHRGRGWGPAYAATARRLPALTLGACDERGLVPHSHRPDDLPSAIDARSTDQLLELGLLFVDALAARLSRQARDQRSTPGLVGEVGRGSVS